MVGYRYSQSSVLTFTDLKKNITFDQIPNRIKKPIGRQPTDGHRRTARESRCRKKVISYAYQRRHKKWCGLPRVE